MNDSEFEYLRTLLKQQSGLALTLEKRYLIESRLLPVCRKYTCANLSELVTKLKSGRDAALQKAVIEAMTTNETFFFRDRVPFDIFKDQIMPKMLTARAGVKKLRVWSAAASSGQEAYSLAMIFAEMGHKLSGWQIEILATDLSDDILERAKTGVYTQFEVQRGLPVQYLLKYFTQEGDLWRISSALRNYIHFRPLNLIRDFGALGQFDVIFCRNVLIYFDGPTKAAILNRMRQSLAADGALFLGAAETVIGLTDTFIPDTANRGLYLPNPSANAAAQPRLAVAG